MTDLDLDAIEARARTTYPSSDAAPLMRDIPMLVREVRRLTAALAAEKREHNHDASLLTHMTEMYKEEVARAERAEADALAQRSIATREAQERRDHQDRADRQAAALREVGALADEAGPDVSCGGLTVDADGCFAGALAGKIRTILARHSGGESEGPARHIGAGANAEDCPACAGTNPPYPFICPGEPGSVDRSEAADG